MSGWSTPFLSVLSGPDKDALQNIFTSLTTEINRLSARIDDLEKSRANPKSYKEQRGY